MALTRIQKGMIAAGAVTPENLDSTANFSFNKITTPEIDVSGSNGLKIDALRSSTSTYGLYYNISTKELTYGLVGAGTSFNQNLNTTDKVTFAGVAATTATFGGVNIANLRINNAFTMPTTAGSIGQVLATNGTTATWVTPGVTGNQALFTTSSVTFANITITGNSTVNGLADFAQVRTNYITALPGSPSTITVGALRLAFTALPTEDGTISLGNSSYRFSGINAYSGNFSNDVGIGGAIVFSDGSRQTTASGTPNQSLNTTDVVTFAGMTATSITTRAIRAIPGSSSNKIVIGSESSTPNSTGWGVNLVGPLTIYPGYTTGHILPATRFQNLGDSVQRWQALYVKTIVVSKNTIIFEDFDEITSSTISTSTLSISTGTVYVDGNAVVDQPVTSDSSPTFLSINGTTSTFEDIVVTSELFFGDDSVQTTAFSGNQALYTTSTVTFGAMTVTNSATVGALVFSSDGLPINSRSELIGPQGPQGDPGQSSSLFDYKAKTGIYTNDPGTGNMLWNNATQTSATALHFSHIDNLGDDIEYLLSFHQVGDLLRIQNKSNSEQYQVWQISAPITVNTGTYISMPVSLVSSTHSFGNNDIVAVIFRSAGADQSLNTTSNVVFNSVRVSANVQFPDATTQTTAWTGSVSTSSVTGLATVGWSGNYNDLSNRPSIASSDQALFTTSSVVFKSSRATQLLSSGGYPLDSNGQALISTNGTQTPAMVVSNYTSGLLPRLYVRGYGQNNPSGTASTAGGSSLFLEGARGTHTSPTVSGSGDTIGVIQFSGYDGANWLSNQSTAGVANLAPASVIVQTAEAFANNGSATTNAGTNMFLRVQPIGTQLNSTSRRTFLATSWTAGSTATNSPPIMGLGIGQHTDATTPTLTPASGVGSFGTGSGRTNLAMNGVLSLYFGVPAQDTGPDNSTITGTNQLIFVTSRRSPTSGRRDTLAAGDTIFSLLGNVQTANNATGNGSTSASLVFNAIEATSGSVRGSRAIIQTTNTGTNTLTNRMLLDDRLNEHRSAVHSFKNSSGGDDSTVRIGTVDQTAKTVTGISGSSAVAVFTFDKTVYSGAKLVSMAKDGANTHLVEMLITTDGTNTNKTEYAVTTTGTGELGTYSVGISGNTVTVYFTPTSATSMFVRVGATLL